MYGFKAPQNKKTAGTTDGVSIFCLLNREQEEEEGKKRPVVSFALADIVEKFFVHSAEGKIQLLSIFLN